MSRVSRKGDHFPIGIILLNSIYILFSFILLFSLISYNSNDTAIYSGGVGGPMVLENWFGLFGAKVSRWMLLFIGLAAYPLCVVLCLASIRRVIKYKRHKSTIYEYIVVVALFVFGCSMLFGVWPNLFADFTAKLDIARMPGGVIGQRFCSPGGFLRLFIHPTGSALISGFMIAIGLVMLIIYDWWDLLAEIFMHHFEESPEEKTTRKKAEDKKVTALKQAELLSPDPVVELEVEKEDEPAALPELVSEPAPEPVKPAKPAAPVPQQQTFEFQPANGDFEMDSHNEKPAHHNINRDTNFTLPPLKLLNDLGESRTNEDPVEIEKKKESLQVTLDSFGIDAQVGEATSGPRVTLFEVSTAPGVKVEKISSISNNIAMELCATSLRILTPIPGKSAVGIEVPNTTAAPVSFKSLLKSKSWTNTKAEIPLALGRNISGDTVIFDLAKAPHLLIAGATGSGKSVCINSLIMSMLYKFSPSELRLVMVDPKVVEFKPYESLPHLVVPVISDVKRVPLALRWTINEMERRYRVLAKVGVRNLKDFNNRRLPNEPQFDDEGNEIPDKLPFIVVIIDELADVMMTAKADVETSLARIAQLSRAVGIHTIIATQRPSVNVITGVIKANFPTRIAFQVTSQIDSRTILDAKGAEMLLGRGDMLFKSSGAAGVERNQGAMVDDDEIEKTVEFVAAQADQCFENSMFGGEEAGGGDDSGGSVDFPLPGGSDASDEEEDLVRQAIEIIKRDKKASTSYLQRCMRIGYNKAATVMEILEERGVIGPQIGSAKREILIDTTNTGQGGEA